jgi:5-methyltetrahydrofolate--homocysteine methyltransferase
MSKKNILDEVTNAIAEIDFTATPKLCKEAAESGISTMDIVNALSKGMDIIGNRFETKEYFLSELIMAGEIFSEAQKIINPYIEKGEAKDIRKVVIGTVEGDLHDIGKNIVIVLLRVSGVEVTDLGINIPVSKFIDAVREIKPDVLGMSALLRATIPQMGAVIKELEKEGLRDTVKIIVGGLPLNDEYAKRLGADHYAKDAWLGVEIIKKLVGI